jgi:hypothetical protein
MKFRLPYFSLVKSNIGFSGSRYTVDSRQSLHGPFKVLLIPLVPVGLFYSFMMKNIIMTMLYQIIAKCIFGYFLRPVSGRFQ